MTLLDNTRRRQRLDFSYGFFYFALKRIYWSKNYFVKVTKKKNHFVNIICISFCYMSFVNLFMCLIPIDFKIKLPKIYSILQNKYRWLDLTFGYRIKVLKLPTLISINCWCRNVIKFLSYLF